MSNQRDITITKGDTYIQQVIFDESQAGYSFAATLNSQSITTSLAADNVTVTLSLTAAQTAALDADGSTIYKWKLRRTSSAATPTVLTILHGKASVVSV